MRSSLMNPRSWLIHGKPSRCWRPFVWLTAVVTTKPETKNWNNDCSWIVYPLLVLVNDAENQLPMSPIHSPKYASSSIKCGNNRKFALHQAMNQTHHVSKLTSTKQLSVFWKCINLSEGVCAKGCLEIAKSVVSVFMYFFSSFILPFMQQYMSEIECGRAHTRKMWVRACIGHHDYNMLFLLSLHIANEWNLIMKIVTKWPSKRTQLFAKHCCSLGQCKSWRCSFSFSACLCTLHASARFFRI